MASVTLRAVKKSYGKNAVVHGVDLDIPAGTFVVILGPSGCGKSTLLRMIAGLEEITSGEVSIGGRIVNRLEPRRRGCAMVFQNYALYPHMTVAENIGYALKVAGLSKAERRARVEKVAESLGLAPFLDRKPAALSGGQRQRVAMGRAMIREPSVFLFDEPLSNLDARLRVQMRAEIRRLHQRLGATSIFVTHDQVEAMTLADLLVVMNEGRIEQAGSPAELYAKPVSRFVASFVGAPPMNLMDGRIAANGEFLYDEPRRLALPAGLPLAAGTLLTVGIRPEAVSIAAPGAPGSIRATVDVVEELGAGRVVHLDLAGQPFAVATAGAVTLRPGETVGLVLPADALHLFEHGSGRRLDITAHPAEPAALSA